MVFLEKKIFEIVMEYLKLISGYIKSFADSSRKLSPVVVFNLKKLVGENKLVGEQNRKNTLFKWLL